MLYTLVLKPYAISMQKETYDWYEAQQAGLGEVFLDELDRCYKKLSSFPTAYGKEKGNYRSSRLRKFPYVIIFRIIKRQVVVYAVFHTSRNPGEKLKRRS